MAGYGQERPVGLVPVESAGRPKRFTPDKARVSAHGS